MSGQAGRYQRSTAGMVGAMIVLVVLVAAFVVARDVNRRDLDGPVRAIDYAQDAEFARDQASFALVAPPELPEGWRATTAQFVSGDVERWHLGLLTDDDRYVGLEQSASSAVSMVEAHVDAEAEQGDPVEVGDEQWQTWSDEGGDLALVRETAGTTTLVVGHVVPEGELVAFAGSLR